MFYLQQIILVSLGQRKTQPQFLQLSTMTKRNVVQLIHISDALAASSMKMKSTPLLPVGLNLSLNTENRVTAAKPVAITVLCET
jgi:hypothetical protein